MMKILHRDVRALKMPGSEHSFFNAQHNRCCWEGRAVREPLQNQRRCTQRGGGHNWDLIHPKIDVLRLNILTLLPREGMLNVFVLIKTLKMELYTDRKHRRHLKPTEKDQPCPLLT